MKSIPLLILVAISFTMSAQDSIPRDSITQLDEVILLDALQRSSATGIVPSEIIAAKVFQNYGPVSMAPAMNQIPGVFVLSGAINTNRITIRGIGSRTLFGTDKLRMYYSDIPVTDGSGISTIEAFDLENLAQMEVIKGPKETAYGANLGGTIILSPKEALGQSTNIANTTTLGSFGLFKNHLSLNHNDGRLRLGLTYGHLQTQGYRENNDFERDGFLFNADYRLDSKNALTILINHIDYTAQIPSSLGATDFEENPQQAAFTWAASKGFETNNYSLAGLNYSHVFSDALESSTSLFYSYLDHYEARPFGILDEYTNGFGFRTRWTGNFDFLGSTAYYSFGGELYKDEYTWDEYENLYEESEGNGSVQGDRFTANKEFREQAYLFGTLTLPVTERLTAQAGIAVNRTGYDFRDNFNTGQENRSASRNFDAIWLPSLTLDYTFTQDFTAYANVSKGFSNPTVEETLTPDGVINPDIAQETGVNYELGTELYLDQQRFHLNLSLYGLDVRNLLVAERVDNDRFIGRNAGRTRHLGMEVAMEYVWEIGDGLELSPFVSYTLTDHSFVRFIDGDNDFSGNRLTGVPKQRRTAGIRFRTRQGAFANLTHRHVSDIPLTDANTVYSDAYTVFTLRTGYRTKVSDHMVIGIDLGIDNLLDARYAQSVLINTGSFGGSEPRYFYPGDGRNFFGSVRLGYKF